MNDLYDVITALRQKHRLSSRMLANQAKIPPTTLASMMSRRPSTVDKEILIRIALALGVKWVDLLNKPDSYANECALEDRIPVDMSKEDIQAVREKLIDPLLSVVHFGTSSEAAARVRQKYCSKSAEENDFKRSFTFVLDKLNDDGLLEAMKRVLEISENPRYRKKNREDKEWQEEELPTAAEQSGSDQMDDMKQ